MQDACFDPALTSNRALPFASLRQALARLQGYAFDGSLVEGAAGGTSEPVDGP